VPNLVTLILTNSLDITVDRLIRHIGPSKIFRFNMDLWEEYDVTVTCGDFQITNLAGGEVRKSQISKCLWRKPMSKYRIHWTRDIPQQTIYTETEIFYAMREIKNLLWREGKLILIEPGANLRIGKLVQLEVGRKFFIIPSYEFFSSPRTQRQTGRERIVKSLSSERVTEDKYLWTTRVKEDELDPNAPWMVQDRVEATHDVTVVFVRDKMFGFALDRRGFVDQTDDWREVGDSKSLEWETYPLTSGLEEAITGFMTEIGLHYGRLDFLYDGTKYFFLEVNSNGEWDWLDPKGDVGLLNKMLEEIHPDSRLHSIPLCWHP